VVLPSEAITFIAAELLLLLTRTDAITCLLKKESQRTAAERERVANGLGRGLAAEAILFVPASAWLVLLAIEPNLPAAWLNGPGVHALLGVISYGFPFAAVKQIVTVAAVRSLKAAYEVISEAEKRELQKHTSVARADSGGPDA
jgi:hypothetical protein